MDDQYLRTDMPVSSVQLRSLMEAPLRLMGGWHETLYGRMVLGAIAFVALLGSATYLGYGAVERLTNEMETQLARVEQSTRLTNELGAVVRQQVEAGRRYAEAGDPAWRRQFDEMSSRADELSSIYGRADWLLPSEREGLASLGEARRALEGEYSAAHNVRAAGRNDEAVRRVRQAEPAAAALLAELAAFSLLPAARLNAAAAELHRTGDGGRRLLLIVFFLSGALATGLLFSAVQAINRPLLKLGNAARLLGEGDLRVELTGRMLREFDILSSNFNSMAGRLRGFVQETVTISDYIATSSRSLTNISERVATSSSEVASAMAEITRAAEGQSTGLVETCTALDDMRRRGGRIDEAAHQVVEFSEGIRELAEKNRDQMVDAIRLVFELRRVVGESEAEARELDTASLKIDRFVEMISTVARQTNLLALNAAIEAARAGEHGRGFAVVAEEVRKLADGSAEAAREVAGIVTEVRSKIERIVSTMEQGAKQVGEVEEVARGAEGALEQIMSSVGGVRDATIDVNDALFENRLALQRVEAALLDVAGAAESHAASAQQVAAAAEQQSAATEQVSVASGELLQAAGRMKSLISGLKT